MDFINIYYKYLFQNGLYKYLFTILLTILIVMISFTQAFYVVDELSFMKLMK